MKAFLGFDVGSVSTNLALLDPSGSVLLSVYLRTAGDPLKAVQRSHKQLMKQQEGNIEIAGAGVTGSARELTGVFVGADVIKNEITAHAMAALALIPNVRTVVEIGGQDSKIILLRDGVVTDFAMNTVCAAGTGSFLDRQADRLELPIEQFGEMAAKAKASVRIAGRCAVFAESDMIHKQQVGHGTPEIIRGLCDALVRNYLNNVGKGKKILEPVVFQGGVAANTGIKAALERQLEMEVIVPEHHKVMGAIGAALLAREEMAVLSRDSHFRGLSLMDVDYRTGSFECDECSNECEILEVYVDGEVAGRWGGRCERWERLERSSAKQVQKQYV